MPPDPEPAPEPAEPPVAVPPVAEPPVALQPEPPVEELSDGAAEKRLFVAGKTEQRDTVPVGRQRLLQALRLRSLAGAVDSFQSDEHRHAVHPASWALAAATSGAELK